MIGITGATGNIGGMAASLLLDSGAQLRLLARTPARLTPALTEATPKPEVAQAHYTDDAATRAALAGVDVLLMVSATESLNRVAEHQAFINAAAAAGVGHVVYTSFLNAAPEATFTHARDHWHTEQALKASGMRWTILRDSFYLDFFAELIESGEIRGPGGSGKCAGVARIDVARSAAAILADPAAHAGATYDLTGPQAMTLAQAAALGSQVLGRDIPYIDETLEEAYASREPYGAPDWEVEAWVSTYTAIAAGELDVVSGDVESLTGRKPVGLAQLLSERTNR